MKKLNLLEAGSYMQRLYVNNYIGIFHRERHTAQVIPGLITKSCLQMMTALFITSPAPPGLKTLALLITLYTTIVVWRLFHTIITRNGRWHGWWLVQLNNYLYGDPYGRIWEEMSHELCKIKLKIKSSTKYWLKNFEEFVSSSCNQWKRLYTWLQLSLLAPGTKRVC